MNSAGHGLNAVYAERNYAWKLLLPLIPERPVLAAGLDGPGLVSLGRSWRTVRAVNSPEGALEWAKGQAGPLGLGCRFEPAGVDECPYEGYHAIAVGTGNSARLGPEKAWRLLSPGGTVIWAGHHRQLPGNPQLRESGYGRVKRYALIPPGKCKVIVPVSDRMAAITGLGFYVPGKPGNRIAYTAGMLAAMAGLQRYLSKVHLVTAGRPGDMPAGSLLFDWLGERLGVRVADASMYPGSGSSGRRRATLLAMDAAGHPVAVIKVADTLPGMDVNKKEAEVLELLGRDNRFRGIAPGVICSGGWQGHQVLALEYMRPAGCRYVTGLTSAHTRFLESLSGLDRREALLHEWTGWRRLLDWSDKNGFKTDDDADAVRQTIKRCAGILSGLKLTMHRIHGDFSPWNTFLAGDRLVVFDWEHSEPCGLPFYDLVHFVIRRKHYIDNEPLSHGELLAATPESLGVREEVLALGSAVPQIKDARGKDRADISDALFRLCVLYAAAVKTSVRR